jgi:NAD-dependent deacetylase
MLEQTDPGLPEDALDRAEEVVRQARRVAVLSGAGVSAESGVPTFRGASGLWEGHAITDVATPTGFARDPALVWRFYNARRAAMHAVAPNPGHIALAALERRFANRFTLATQNIDGLHQSAGSRNVLELHGRLSRVRCTACAYLADRPGEVLPDLPHCPECGSLLRPDVVWFEEMLPHGVWREAYKAAEACDCFLVVGTSAVVFPAAGLIEVAAASRARILEFNLERTAASSRVDLGLYGPSGRMLPEVLKRI